MENETIYCETLELIKRIKYNQEELEKLQKECKHEDSFMKNIGPENGTIFDLWKICKICNKNIAKVNREELDNWLKK